MTGTEPPAVAPSNWNAPNIITAARIIATPFFLWMLLADGGADGPWRWASAAFFVLAIATDAWDGYLARSRGLITDLGKLLDPIADKFLTGAALIGLSILLELPWWVTVLILVREVGITIHRLVVVNNVVLAAAWTGKLKTVAQSVAITLALLPLAHAFPAAAPVFEWINIITMSIAFVLTMVSGIDYVVAYMRSQRPRSTPGVRS
ncbi:CDP-diacylglycerol--glycerol-3-phosphate 3-phosphatidyltransferase [Leucobacter sp. USHLN153]|uniref:CDP-diacylglycerol--glycerol-3-phosphate 3-phosphatidyltransferase n=1 Tax=Leucobacter sp. USHLN153 TaxID=3081268 RepID=UPI003018C243